MELTKDQYLSYFDASFAKFQETFEKHFNELSELKQTQRELAEHNARLVQTQEKFTENHERLTTTLDQLNDNLTRGISLGEHVVSLFGRIVLVFLVVVVGLGGLIVYIANLEVNYKDFGLHAQPRSTLSDTP